MNIQYPFDNTYSDIWEYQADFFNICFQDYIGTRCLVCGSDNCCRPISEYERYAIELFPFKKAKVMVARFECRKSHTTISLLPHQLIPYHQYTVDAVVKALLMVISFQEKGQTGYYGAACALPADCDVTPYLIQTWAMLLLTGFLRGHPVLQKAFPLPEPGRPSRGDIMKTILLYLQSTGNADPPDSLSPIGAIRYYFRRTGRWLFGKSACDRRPP